MWFKHNTYKSEGRRFFVEHVGYTFVQDIACALCMGQTIMYSLYLKCNCFDLYTCKQKAVLCAICMNQQRMLTIGNKSIEQQYLNAAVVH